MKKMFCSICGKRVYKTKEPNAKNNKLKVEPAKVIHTVKNPAKPVRYDFQ